MTDRTQFVPIEEPYDDHEAELIRRIEELKREYEAAIKPYVTALVRSRQLKPLRGFMCVGLLDAEYASLNQLKAKLDDQ